MDAHLLESEQFNGQDHPSDAVPPPAGAASPSPDFLPSGKPRELVCEQLKGQDLPADAVPPPAGAASPSLSAVPSGDSQEPDDGLGLTSQIPGFPPRSREDMHGDSNGKHGLEATAVSTAALDGIAQRSLQQEGTAIEGIQDLHRQTRLPENHFQMQPRQEHEEARICGGSLGMLGKPRQEPKEDHVLEDELAKIAEVTVKGRLLQDTSSRQHDATHVECLASEPDGMEMEKVAQGLNMDETKRRISNTNKAFNLDGFPPPPPSSPPRLFMGPTAPSRPSSLQLRLNLEVSMPMICRCWSSTGRQGLTAIPKSRPPFKTRFRTKRGRFPLNRFKSRGPSIRAYKATIRP